MTGDAPQPPENDAPDAPGTPGAWPPAGSGGVPGEPAGAAAPARPRSPRRRSVVNPPAGTEPGPPEGDTTRPPAAEPPEATSATPPDPPPSRPTTPPEPPRGRAAGSSEPPRGRPAPKSRPAPPSVTQPTEIMPSVPPRTVLPEVYGGAHAAGARDAADALEAPAAQVEAEREDRIARIEHAAAAETVAHAGTGAEPEPQPAVPDPETRPEPAVRVDGVPDVMVLPEPNRNRPTVAIEPERPRPAPTQPTESALETARRRMENSPFWLSEEQRAAAAAENPAPAPAIAAPPRRLPAEPRRPLPGLAALIVLALAAAFFSWVSAEPFWLAVGHGDPGTATVSRCIGSGVTQRCTGTFAAADGRYTANRVIVLGVESTAARPGATVPARMVAADSRQAYAGTGPLVHLRWVLGFVLVLLCGYGIAGTTGARRLGTSRSRRQAVLISLAGPALLLVGFLVAAY